MQRKTEFLVDKFFNIMQTNNSEIQPKYYYNI